MYIVYICVYHRFLRQSSVCDFLGCFYALALVKHWCACIFLNYSFVQTHAQEWHYWIIQYSGFSFHRNFHTVFHSGYTLFTFPPTVSKGSLFSMSSLAFIICRLLRMAILNMEKATAPHSSTLAWRIPWTEEPGELQSMGL